MAIFHKNITMKMSAGMDRMDAFPLDASSIYTSLQDAQNYAQNASNAYVGQILTVLGKGIAPKAKITVGLPAIEGKAGQTVSYFVEPVQLSSHGALKVLTLLDNRYNKINSDPRENDFYVGVTVNNKEEITELTGISIEKWVGEDLAGQGNAAPALSADTENTTDSVLAYTYTYKDTTYTVILELQPEVDIATAYVIDNADGLLKEVGSISVGDGNTIEVTSDGIIRLVGAADAAVGQIPRIKADGSLEWVSVETVVAAIPEITITDDEEATVPQGATVNVYKDLTVDGTTKHTLKEELVQVATAKGVADALKEAKDYADNELKNYVKSVSGKDAIKSTGGQTPEISIALDNSGNVQFTQSTTGLKGNVDLSNLKTKQTAVEDKITDKAHVLESLTQNVNGEISYTVKTLTPADIGAQPVGNYKTKQTAVDETGATNKTVTKVTQDANGVVNVTFSDIKITESQIKDLHKVEVAEGDYINVTTSTNTDATTGAVTTTYTVAVDETVLSSKIAAVTTAAMEFKGATSALPTSSNNTGDMYKVSGSFEVPAANDAQGNGFTAQIGDSIVYDGSKWYLIPSGDDIEDTWRTIQVKGSPIESSNTVNFVGGDHINVEASVDSSNTDVTNVTISLDHDYIHGYTINEGESGAIGFDLYRQGDCVSSNDERIVGMVINAGDEMEVEATETYDSLVMGTISHKEIDCTVTSGSSTLNHKDTFDVVKSITVNDYGHVTELATETYTLPEQYEHPDAENSESSNETTLAHGDSFNVITESFDDQGHRTGTHIETYTLPALPTPEDIGAATAEDYVRKDNLEAYITSAAKKYLATDIQLCYTQKDPSYTGTTNDEFKAKILATDPNFKLKENTIYGFELVNNQTGKIYILDEQSVSDSQVSFTLGYCYPVISHEEDGSLYCGFYTNAEDLWQNVRDPEDNIIPTDDDIMQIYEHYRLSFYEIDPLAFGIEKGAQVNTIETIKVNGTALDIEDKAVDITIKASSTNGSLTINGSDITVYTLPTDITTKLDDIEAGAQVNAISTVSSNFEIEDVTKKLKLVNIDPTTKIAGTKPATATEDLSLLDFINSQITNANLANEQHTHQVADIVGLKEYLLSDSGYTAGNTIYSGEGWTEETDSISLSLQHKLKSDSIYCIQFGTDSTYYIKTDIGAIDGSTIPLWYNPEGSEYNNLIVAYADGDKHFEYDAADMPISGTATKLSLHIFDADNIDPATIIGKTITIIELLPNLNIATKTVATTTDIGLVKSTAVTAYDAQGNITNTATINKVNVGTDGTMTVNAISVDKLENNGYTLVLFGGNAAGN